MELTPAQVIGMNVKELRESRGLTAKQLGEKLGEVFPRTKDGATESKPWPTSTVYMMEAGDRAMISVEVVALAEVLDVPVSHLFAPRATTASGEAIEGIIAGTLSVFPENLRVPMSAADSNVESAAESVMALERASKELRNVANAQIILIDDAKRALQGAPLMQSPAGNRPQDLAVRMQIQAADHFYQYPKIPLRDLDGTETSVEGEDNGEGN